MHYRQCLIFYTVAKEKSFTRAAQKLFMTQSAISHSMKDLETEAGTALFERLHRQIALTAAGVALLATVTPLIEEFQRVENQLQNLEQTAPLRLASCITYGEITLSKVLHQFKKNRPQQKINVHISPAEDCFQKLAAGKVDLAILEGRVPSGNYQQKVIADYPLVFVAAPDFLPKASPTLSLSELLNQPLLLRERGSAVRETFEAFLTLKRLHCSPTWESTDSASLIAAAKNKMGISLLPYSLVVTHLKKKELVAVSVTKIKLHNEITALRPAGANRLPALEELWELL
ncbi:LysR family transcriptional regulator [Enterococcus saigonensis]|uniref:LysR family transcriptional regulator n=1 Tax=Enterococcus saigonensis TaxID=1805431 RepID=A0A679IPQ1_9ENTE|nr:LysR family transcriptional regulator [Enterococcus saigonensis]BCA86891.1 LysR family transcriptional regulator [Enterococcus saigonensis]